MRTLRFLLRKEFRQIFRDKSIVAMIFFMPMVQLILMPLAADYEVRNINLAVVDHDKSPYSQKLISKIARPATSGLRDTMPHSKRHSALSKPIRRT
jgi:ABC-2 type transport system permease protein